MVPRPFAVQSIVAAPPKRTFRRRAGSNFQADPKEIVVLCEMRKKRMR
jgi:hypothetical protein